MQQLLCPKCHNVMHQYERNGVLVDQCTECKGLFLDRGELEKLVTAETTWYGGPDRPEPRYEPQYRRHDDDYRRRKKDRRRSFLEDLFD